MGLSPHYLYDLFSFNDSRTTYKINTPIPRIDLFKTSLSYSGSVFWNSLPNNLKAMHSFSLFKDKLFSYLLNKSSNQI